MTYILAILCIALMALCLMLLFLGLPGNWVILGLAALWSYFSDADFGWKFFLLLAGLAAVGEVLEFLAGSIGARRFGGTRKGSWGGIIGALVGGIACAPLFFGFGALLGALSGAFAGCFIIEKMHGMATAKAASAALGSALGRFGGFLAKFGIGLGMIYLSAQQIWAGL
ncbi:MAG: DUF456 domain-containing protein [Deltaproteobacteria bacterium]|jgi:uncharacterized protein YqgC (DUF456 family)|nr:DUF456 domain-containing protein [Deltaproteobacteria bacterium]